MADRAIKEEILTDVANEDRVVADRATDHSTVLVADGATETMFASGEKTDDKVVVADGATEEEIVADNATEKTMLVADVATDKVEVADEAIDENMVVVDEEMDTMLMTDGGTDHKMIVAGAEADNVVVADGVNSNIVADGETKPKMDVADGAIEANVAVADGANANIVVADGATLPKMIVSGGGAENIMIVTNVAQAIRLVADAALLTTEQKFFEVDGPTESSKEIQKKQVQKNQNTKSFKCPTCSNAYTRKTTLRKHMATTHNEVFPVQRPLVKHKCLHATCSEQFQHITSMLQHLKEKHGDSIDETTYEFNSMDDFKQWKEMEEAQNFVFFAKSGSSVKSKHYYVCQRHGSQRAHRSKNEPARKTNRRNKQGSVKSDMICPARMLLKVSNSGKVTVKYIYSHNHPISIEDTGQQPLPPSLRDDIKTKLAMGVRQGDILKDLSEGKSEESDSKLLPIKRKYLISKQQIVGLKRHKYGPKRLNRDDSISVSLKVENLMNGAYNPVLMYKGKGVVTQSGHGDIDRSGLEDFDDITFLAFQTQEQCRVLGSHGRLLYVDTKRCTDKYPMKLLNIIVDYDSTSGGGYPVGHLITSSMNKIILKEFFVEIRKRVPNLKFSAIMTDDMEEIFDVIVEVFGNEENVRHFHSKWSFHCTSLKLINDNILCDDIAGKQTVLRKEMYHELVKIMEEKTLDTYEILVAHFLFHYLSFCPSLVEIFKTKYFNQPKPWAMCYRYVPNLATSIDSSLHAEKFHNKLLQAYYAKTTEKCRRVDELLDVLLTAENEEYWRRKAEVESKMVGPVRKTCHEDGLLIPDHCVDSYEATQHWKFKMTSKCIVSRLQLECNEDYCNTMCLELSCLGLCQHLYMCSCPDGAVLCQHKHKVHSMQMRNLLGQTNHGNRNVEHGDEHSSEQQQAIDSQSTLPTCQSLHVHIDHQDGLKLPDGDSQSALTYTISHDQSIQIHQGNSPSGLQISQDQGLQKERLKSSEGNSPLPKLISEGGGVQIDQDRLSEEGNSESGLQISQDQGFQVDHQNILESSEGNNPLPISQAKGVQIDHQDVISEGNDSIQTSQDQGLQIDYQDRLKSSEGNNPLSIPQAKGVQIDRQDVISEGNDSIRTSQDQCLQVDYRDRLKSSERNVHKEQRIHTECESTTVMIQNIQNEDATQSHDSQIVSGVSKEPNPIQVQQTALTAAQTEESMSIPEDPVDHENYKVLVLQGPTSSDASTEAEVQVNHILSQVDVLKDHLQNERVRQLLLPHVSDTLAQLISQCNVVLNAEVVEVTEQDTVGET